MNNFQLKILAYVFMMIDHIGVVFFPNLVIFRIIGRLAFPLFAWHVALGYKKTSNIYSYATRLLLFAVISQIPHFLAVRTDTLNIFFTLFFGLVSVYLFDKLKNKYLSMVAILIVAVLAEFLGLDYGTYGVISILFFYLFFENFKRLVLYQALINLLYFSFFVLSYIFSYGFEVVIKETILWQPISLLSLIFIYYYNGQHGKKLGYSFYLIYPLHLLMFYFLKLLI